MGWEWARELVGTELRGLVVCSEVDPVSGLVCLETSGREHRRHYGLGFDAGGSWSVSWLDGSEIMRLLALRVPLVSRADFEEQYPRDMERWAKEQAIRAAEERHPDHGWVTDLGGQLGG